MIGWDFMCVWEALIYHIILPIGSNELVRFIVHFYRIVFLVILLNKNPSSICSSFQCFVFLAVFKKTS